MKTILFLLLAIILSAASKSYGQMVQYNFDTSYMYDINLYYEITEFIFEKTCKGEIDVFKNKELTQKLSLEEYFDLLSFEIVTQYRPYDDDPDFLVDTVFLERFAEYDLKYSFTVNWENGNTISGQLFSFGFYKPDYGSENIGVSFWYKYEDLQKALSDHHFYLLTYANYRLIQDKNDVYSTIEWGYYDSRIEKNTSMLRSRANLKTYMKEKEIENLNKKVYDAVMSEKTTAYVSFSDSLTSSISVEDVEYKFSYETVEVVQDKKDKDYYYDTVIIIFLDVKNIIGHYFNSYWKFDPLTQSIKIEPKGLSLNYFPIVDGVPYKREQILFFVKLEDIQKILPKKLYENITDAFYSSILSSH